jgi:hypothetical protein
MPYFSSIIGPSDSGSLPLRGLVLGLRKLRDVVAGILERDELATAGQRNRIVKASLPTVVRQHQRAPPR